MKRIILFLVVLLLILLNTSWISSAITDNSINLSNSEATGSSSLQNNDQITILLNDKKLSFDVDPYIKSGRTLVPFRGILEALGAQVGWNPNERSVTAKSKSTEIYLKIGESQAFVNGRRVSIDVPAEIKNGRTFLPLRFMSENLGAYVGWDGETRTVSIQYENSTNSTGEIVDNGGIKIAVDKVEFVSEDEKLLINGRVTFNGNRIFISVVDIDGYSTPAFFESVGDEEDEEGMMNFIATVNTQLPHYVAECIVINVRSEDGKLVKIAEFSL